MTTIIRPVSIVIGERQLFAMVMPGECWYRLSCWKRYGMYSKFKAVRGFHIGPIMFWEGRR